MVCYFIIFQQLLENPYCYFKMMENQLSQSTYGASTNPRVKVERVDSPAPSLVSMRSDCSKDIPLNFSGDPSRKPMIGASPLTESLRCAVCLGTLSDPVSIPCGHTSCRRCIISHWEKLDAHGRYSCPDCSEQFETKPELQTNKMVARWLRRHGREAASSSSASAQPGDVTCDICIGQKLKAVKTCLKCDVAYCEEHIKDHFNIPALQRHLLVDVWQRGESQELNVNTAPLPQDKKDSVPDDVVLPKDKRKKRKPSEEPRRRGKRMKTEEKGGTTSKRERMPKMMKEFDKLKRNIKLLRKETRTLQSTLATERAMRQRKPSPVSKGTMQVNLRNNITAGLRRGRVATKRWQKDSHKKDGHYYGDNDDDDDHSDDDDDDDHGDDDDDHGDDDDDDDDADDDDDHGDDDYDDHGRDDDDHGDDDDDDGDDNDYDDHDDDYDDDGDDDDDHGDDDYDDHDDGDNDDYDDHDDGDNDDYDDGDNDDYDDHGDDYHDHGDYDEYYDGNCDSYRDVVDCSEDDYDE